MESNKSVTMSYSLQKNLDSEKNVGESVALIIFKQGIAAEQRKPTGAL